MLISVVIPAFNEAATISQTIAHIKQALLDNQTPSFAWEIIVCDNNSTDDTTLLSQKAGAVVVAEPERQIARARNTGANRASGAWLLFIDADSYPLPALLSEVLGVIRSEKYVGCGTTVEVVDGTLFNKLRMERLNPVFRLLKLCGGAFLLCRRDAFEAIGGFSMSLYAYEEIDFVIRLKKYARSIHQDFVILHEHPVITSGRKGDYTFASMIRLFASNIAAVFLFGLHYILPAQVVKKMGSHLLGYWYNSREG